METYAYTINLKKDDALVEQYLEHHRAVWPEVLTSLKEVGVEQMKIFRVGYKMFMYMEAVDGFNPSVDFPRYLTLDDRCQVWEDLMGTFQEVCEEAQEDEKWALMEEAFDFKEQINNLSVKA